MRPACCRPWSAFPACRRIDYVGCAGAQVVRSLSTAAPDRATFVTSFRATVRTGPATPSTRVGVIRSGAAGEDQRKGRRGLRQICISRRATLQALPDEPRFVINATNIQSGALWRFSKPYMAHYRVGMVESPTMELADAVGASSAFPPVLSPFEMRLDPNRSGRHRIGLEQAIYQPGDPYRRRRVHLGLETVWNRYDTCWSATAAASSRPRKSRRATGRPHSYRGAEPDR